MNTESFGFENRSLENRSFSSESPPNRHRNDAVRFYGRKVIYIVCFDVILWTKNDINFPRTCADEFISDKSGLDANSENRFSQTWLGFNLFIMTKSILKASSTYLVSYSPQDPCARIHGTAQTVPTKYSVDITGV
jgi:hypothetical protein